MKEKADIKITYPIEKLANKDKTLFFDIETTGFSRAYCNVYLIGCLYFIGDQPMYAQWLAENFNEEANVLMAFHRFLQNYDTIIHFNGNSFDIPFLRERGKKYHLDFDFDRLVSIDIYKSVSGIGALLGLENQKLITYEKALGITRKDPFSGGDLIEVFRQYVESKDERLLFPLLLHNKEDVWNMGALVSLLAFSDLFHHDFSLQDYAIRDYTDVTGDAQQELYITLRLAQPLPIAFTHQRQGIYYKAASDTVQISVQVQKGTYKYFFKNYKDYYYLPLEDRAIHKSVSSFVEQQYRKQATASTCYEKYSGSFVPIFDLKNTSFSSVLKEDSKSKIGWIRLQDIHDDTSFDYCCMLIDSMH